MKRVVGHLKAQIKHLIENKVLLYVNSNRSQLENKFEIELIERKKQLFQQRSAEIVKCRASAQVIGKKSVPDMTQLDYVIHYQFLIHQKGQFYLEEQCEERQALFNNGKMVKDLKIYQENDLDAPSPLARDENAQDRVPYRYNRLAAVQYAEVWWNSYNPKYRKFTDDCTNFISQCLHAGGAPMTGYPNRSKGWWMRGRNYSYSWAVANALRWHLSGSKIGLRAREVGSAKELLLGDVICYDFQGNGRFDHNTMVVAKDAAGMPLVNAHTTNSRMRYWSYEDSTAYTPNIKYKFFTIVDDR